MFLLNIKYINGKGEVCCPLGCGKILYSCGTALHKIMEHRCQYLTEAMRTIEVRGWWMLDDWVSKHLCRPSQRYRMALHHSRQLSATTIAQCWGGITSLLRHMCGCKRASPFIGHSKSGVHRGGEWNKAYEFNVWVDKWTISHQISYTLNYEIFIQL